MENTGTLATLGPQIQGHWQHWAHKYRDTGNIGPTNTETLATLGPQDRGRRQTKHKDITHQTKRMRNTDPTKM